MYISRLIGMPGQLVEALPVDILSHDTVEAKLLQPTVNVNVTLYEEMLNFVFFFGGWGGTKMANPTWRCCLNLGKSDFFWGNTWPTEPPAAAMVEYGSRSVERWDQVIQVIL